MNTIRFIGLPYEDNHLLMTFTDSISVNVFVSELMDESPIAISDRELIFRFKHGSTETHVIPDHIIISAQHDVWLSIGFRSGRDVHYVGGKYLLVNNSTQ